MEFTTNEVGALEKTVQNADLVAVQELNDLQLTFTGGGNAGVIIA